MINIKSKIRNINRHEVAEFLFINKWPYWFAAFSVGVFAFAYAKLFHYSESLAEKFLHNHPYLFLIYCPILFWVSWFVVHYFSKEAKGSGIPQVMAAIAKIEHHESEKELSRFVGIKVTVVKIISSLVCVVGGGAVGREGPTIQIASSIFYTITQKFEKYVKQPINQEFWLITGGAAGIAAAFNTPLGGLVFAIEELSTSHFNKFKSSLITSVVIAGYASQWLGGPYLYLGFPDLGKFTGISAAGWFSFIAIVCGLGGGIFGQIIYSLSMKKEKVFKSNVAKGFLAIFLGLAFALIAVFYNSKILGPGRDILTDSLFNDVQIEYSVPLVRFIGPIISYMTGGAGGIFAPSLAAGGSIGGFISQIFEVGHSQLFVVLGMIGFLSGVTRAPFTAFVLVLEMTDRHSAIFPMMFVALLSAKVAQFINKHSLYELISAKYQNPDPE
ncbi:MAG: chloride channel protein [Bacteriovoracaceae bacterium]|nr:chloride channel protein [Bacteriovoracaceae bacterium]